MTTTPSPSRFLLSQFQLFTSPARALAAETLNLKSTLSDLLNQPYALIHAENALIWQTTALLMCIPHSQKAVLGLPRPPANFWPPSCLRAAVCMG